MGVLLKLLLPIIPAFLLQGCTLEGFESNLADCEYQAVTALSPSPLSGTDRAYLKIDFINSCLKKKGYRRSDNQGCYFYDKDHHNLTLGMGMHQIYSRCWEDRNLGNIQDYLVKKK